MPDRFRIHDAPDAGHLTRLNSGEGCDISHFVVKDVTLRFRDQLVSPLRVGHDSYLIAHSARTDKQCRFFPEHLGSQLLELDDGRIFTIYVIAYFGCRHGLPHCLCRFGDCI